jgi:hypothetical protein
VIAIVFKPPPFNTSVLIRRPSLKMVPDRQQLEISGNHKMKKEKKKMLVIKFPNSTGLHYEKVVETGRN